MLIVELAIGVANWVLIRSRRKGKTDIADGVSLARATTAGDRNSPDNLRWAPMTGDDGPVQIGALFNGKGLPVKSRRIDLGRLGIKRNSDKTIVPIKMPAKSKRNSISNFQKLAGSKTRKTDFDEISPDKNKLAESPQRFQASKGSANLKRRRSVIKTGVPCTFETIRRNEVAPKNGRSRFRSAMSNALPPTGINPKIDLSKNFTPKNRVAPAETKILGRKS